MATINKSLAAAGVAAVTPTPGDNLAIVEVSGTFTTAVGSFQGADDAAGANMSNLDSVRMDTGALEATPTLTNSTVRKWKVDITGITLFQFNLASIASGAVVVQINTLYVPGANPLGITPGGATAGVVANLTGTIGASTAAAGTTTADAGVLPAGTGTTYPTTAADGTKGVRVNAADQVTGRTLFIGNGVSNAILKVYAPSGGVINGAAADAAFSSVSGKGVIIQCLSSAGNTWLAW